MATSGSPRPSASPVELAAETGLLLEPRVLQLDVRGVGAEDVAQARELGLGAGRVPVEERLRHAPRHAAGERDEPGRVAVEELPVDARLVVVALEEAARDELDQVRVALVRLGQKREVREPALELRAVVRDVDLAADNRLDSLLSGLPVQLDGARQRPVVGERDGRHVELGGPLRQVRDPARPVEDRVLGVDVKVDERRVGHGPPIVPTRPARRRLATRSIQAAASASQANQTIAPPREAAPLPKMLPTMPPTIVAGSAASVQIQIGRHSGIRRNAKARKTGAK